mmetsp:Transcript_24514/g.55517  ORF Transcript_24514/g.55517 Transcript_24514/m.55517 type:complete len:202 (+) Transcript_24514:564-1169(+)
MSATKSSTCPHPSSAQVVRPCPWLLSSVTKSTKPSTSSTQAQSSKYHILCSLHPRPLHASTHCHRSTHCHPLHPPLIAIKVSTAGWLRFRRPPSHPHPLPKLSTSSESSGIHQLRDCPPPPGRKVARRRANEFVLPCDQIQALCMGPQPTPSPGSSLSLRCCQPPFVPALGLEKFRHQRSLERCRRVIVTRPMSGARPCSS